MEAIYDNVECVKLDNPTPSTNYTGKKEVTEQGGYIVSYYYCTFVWVTFFFFIFFSGQRSSKRSFYLGVILSLSLLTVLLLVGLITLSFFCELDFSWIVVPTDYQ